MSTEDEIVALREALQAKDKELEKAVAVIAGIIEAVSTQGPRPHSFRVRVYEILEEHSWRL